MSTTTDREKSPPRRRRYGFVSFAALFAIVFAIFLYTIGPVLPPILLGCLLAAFSFPLCERLDRRFGGRTIGAAAVTLGLLVGIAAPVGALGFLIVQRAVRVAGRAPELVRWIDSPSGLGDLLARHPALRWVVPSDLEAQTTAAVAWVANELPALVDGLLDQFLALFLTLLTSFYILRDGRWMLDRLERALPIEPRYTRALVAEFGEVGRGVIVGTLGTAILQGVIAGICFWALGLPEPLLLGALTAAVSVVPVLGSGIVWGPLALWLAVTGELGQAAVLVGVGVLVIGLVDNVARPMLNRGRRGMHPLIVFLGFFGGLAAFGLSGLYLGPLFVGMFVAVMRIYERDLVRTVTRADSQNHWAARNATQR